MVRDSGALAWVSFHLVTDCTILVAGDDAGWKLGEHGDWSKFARSSTVSLEQGIAKHHSIELTRITTGTWVESQLI